MVFIVILGFTFKERSNIMCTWQAVITLGVGLLISKRRLHTHIFFFQAEDGIRDYKVTGVQTCALPICHLLVALSFHHGSWAIQHPNWAPHAACRSGQVAPGSIWKLQGRGCRYGSPARVHEDRKSVV